MRIGPALCDGGQNANARDFGAVGAWFMCCSWKPGRPGFPPWGQALAARRSLLGVLRFLLAAPRSTSSASSHRLHARATAIAVAAIVARNSATSRSASRAADRLEHD